MIYYLVRPVVRFVLRFYYRNIDLTGLEHLPPDAAVILAANHPTAFIEPCIMACFQPRVLSFLARGDLFKSGPARWALAAVNILPVFRMEDGGYRKLRRNFGTFAACYAALSRRKAIMILAEGRCIHEKALRPLRKGTARLALGALAADPTLPEVYIVPVGVNFTHADRVRGTVMVRCGEPIRASAFMDEFRRSEATAIKSLTSHLRARLSPLVVQFPDRETADVGEARLEIDRERHDAYRTYGITHSGVQLDRELVLAAATPNDPLATRYRARLARNGLDRPPSAAGLGPFDSVKVGMAVLLLLPYLPLWLLAEYIGAALPKTIEFYSSVRFAALTGGTLIYFPLCLLLLPWPLKIWCVLCLLGTRWALRRIERLREWWRGRRWEQLDEKERGLLKRMAGAAPPHLTAY